MEKRPSRPKRLLMILGLAIVCLAIVYGFIHNHQAKNGNPSACVNRTFSLGSSGSCIADGQRLLNWYLYGIDEPNYLKVTSSFNSNTEQAVKKTQSGASLVVNGRLDNQTWQLICQGEDRPSWWVSAAKNAGCPNL